MSTSFGNSDASKPHGTDRPDERVQESMPLLLVEDDDITRDRLEGLLTRARFDVYSVSSAREAREMMRALVFPLVVIDRILGDGDGISLIGELRRRYEPHRVFLMLFSALDSEEERRSGIAAGADDYLSKRSSDEELLGRLTAAKATVRLRSK